MWGLAVVLGSLLDKEELVGVSIFIMIISAVLWVAKEADNEK